MTNFIETQKELAREEMRGMYYDDSDEFPHLLDTLITQVIQNTLEEVGRVVERERNKIFDSGEFGAGQIDAYGNIEIRLQSLLAEMTHPPQEQGENVNTPDTEMESVEEIVEKSGHVEEACDFAPSARVMHLPYVKKLLQDDRTSRDTYWKERVQKEVDELWHDLGKYQGWLGGVMGNETDFTLMQQQPTKEVREAKALHTAIIMKAKEKVHQTQMKVKSLLDNLK